MWHRNVHAVARQQPLNDKKKKTDARKAKGGFFFIHIQKRDRIGKRGKEKIGKKDAKETENETIA